MKVIIDVAMANGLKICIRTVVYTYTKQMYCDFHSLALYWLPWKFKVRKSWYSPRREYPLWINFSWKTLSIWCQLYKNCNFPNLISPKHIIAGHLLLFIHKNFGAILMGTLQSLDIFFIFLKELGLSFFCYVSTLSPTLCCHLEGSLLPPWEGSRVMTRIGKLLQH